MATIKSEMPPLHAAETSATSLSSLGSGGVSGGGGGGSSGGGGGNNNSNGNSGGGTNGSSTNSGSSASSSGATSGGNTTVVVNNTISAAADSSDNQPGTPQPQQTQQQIGMNDHQQSQTAASSTASGHHAFGAHNMYGQASTTTPGALPHMFGGGGGIYGSSSTGANNGSVHDMQQQQQHHQQQVYPSYLNSYEQFYQQQGQAQSASNQNSSGLDFGNAATLYSSSNANDYKTSVASTGVRYHPYLQTPTSNGGGGVAGNNGSNDGHDASSVSVSSGGVSLSGNNASSGAVSTTTAMSPRVVSSSSPTSTSSQLHMGSGSAGSGNGSGGNPQSPACGQQLLCKKCGIMCTNETELQEHITNVHGASPYGSSGYSSSPYIKEELTGAPPSQSQPQQQQTGGNPGELLDLDSQKMIYPPIPGSMQSIMGGHSGLHHQQHHGMHDPVASDPLHSMHSMQQRALPGWDQTPAIGVQEGLPAYMQQTDISAAKANQSPYYSPKQSPFGGGGGGVVGGANIKHEYPLIKSEYADSQNYVDKSFDPNIASTPDMCQQQGSGNAQQSMLPVSSSPAEFPSTTTGPAQEQQQQYRSFEPPTSSSVLPANSITAKAATWKSNEARRPKTYNCTACNKWFTSSGHLKRHYNTTLHKNAVKTSGQPDPATLPISAHHHPARDPSGKHSRRGGNNSAAAAAAAAAAQQQKPPAPVQPPEPPRTPPDYANQAGVIGSGSVGSGLGPMSHYSTSPSPTNGMPFGQQNGYQQASQSQQTQSYLSQVQSTTTASPQHLSSATNPSQSQNQSQNQAGTILNGHPNGLAGPSAHTTIATAATPTLLMPSSHTRGLLNTTTTTTTIKREANAEEDIINNSNSNRTTNNSSPMDMAMTHTHTHKVIQAMDVVAETEALEMQQHHQSLVKQEEFLDLGQPGYQHLLEQQHQLRHYHNNTPNSRVQSPLITSHQQYQEHLQLQQQQQQQIVADSIFSQQQQQVHMLQPPPLQLPANTMEAYNIIPLDISTQQQHSNSMQLLQPSQRITSTHMATTRSMLDSIPMLQQQQHNLLRQLQQEEREAAEQEHNMLNITTTINSMQDTQQRISTTITPQQPPMLMQLPQLQPSITNPTIPSFQPLQPPEVPLQLEPTMTYHTIIGSNHNNADNNNTGSNCGEVPTTSSDLLQLSSYDPYGSGSMFTTSDGQIVQFMPNNNGGISLMHPTYFTSYPTRTAAVAESYVRSYSSPTTQRSPQEADLPPASSLTYAYARSPQESQTTLIMPPEMPFSPTVSSSTAADNNNTMLDEYHTTNPTTAAATAAATTTKDDFEKDATLLNNTNTKPQQQKSSGKRTRRQNPTANNSVNPPKRKRASSGDAAVTTTSNATNIVLPSGRIKCLDCNKEFTKICYLTQHNKCFHSGEYPYRCEKCGKRFQAEDVYTMHLGRHKTLDKPHKCQLCPKQFHHKTDLRRHIEAIHTGLKQHTCDICEKSFCRKDHLRKHLETHSRPRVVSRKVTNRISAVQQQRTIKATKLIEIAEKERELDIMTERITSSPHHEDSERFHYKDDSAGDVGDDDNRRNHTELDVLFVIKNEPVIDDDDDVEDDDDIIDDDVEMMINHANEEQQQRKALRDQQQQPMAIYMNEGIHT